jgi:hypothetical protein
MRQTDINVDANSQLRVIVLGYLVRGPLGGLAWHYLQYVLGLQRLGHQVYFVEDSDEYESCYDPSQDRMVSDPRYGLEFARQSFTRLGMPPCWAYFDAHTKQWLGPLADSIDQVIENADMLINVSGVTRVRHGLEDIPVRVLIDTDPAFTQITHLTDETARETARQHTAFFTFGENIGKANCSIPDDGIPWQPTRQPIVIDAWPVSKAPADGAFTTVMQWESYPAREFRGQRYGMKSDSFLGYMSLPELTGYPFELAVGSPTAPKDTLREKGWRVINPLEPSKDPWTYQQYLRQSRCEFGVAKHGYVVAHSGWFSERTAAYLASGRPAVVQDTGFSDFLPTGNGLWAFSDLDTAHHALNCVVADYESQCQATREIAAQFFDSENVLNALIEGAFKA